VQREELLRLVGDLPETEVPPVLYDVRRRLRAVQGKPWPPAGFGAGQSNTPDVAGGPRNCWTTGSAAQR